VQGRRFQVDVSDLGEREAWNKAGFDRSHWREVEVPMAWDLYDLSLRARRELPGAASRSTALGCGLAGYST
jgi:hypothetical protein